MNITNELEIRKRIYRRAIIDIETTDPNNPLPEFIVGATIGGTVGYMLTKSPIGTIAGAILGGVITSIPRVLEWLRDQD